MHSSASNLIDGAARRSSAAAAPPFAANRIGTEGLTEQFEYDGLKRLSRVIPNGTTDSNEIVAFKYSPGGQLRCYSSQAQCDSASVTHTYGDPQLPDHLPNALTQHGYPFSGETHTFTYDAKGNQTVKSLGSSGSGMTERAVTYSVFDKPTVISDGAGRSTNFHYGPNRRRYLREDVEGGTMTRTYYIGNVELVVDLDAAGVEQGKFYRRDIAGLATVIITDLGNERIRYLHRDHLGSLDAITDLDSDNLARLTQRLSYDALGQRRLPNDWSALSPLLFQGVNRDTQTVTRWGYTGQEHVDAQGVIHMNGRIYDPEAGRFMQADPLVPFPGLGQSFNRYSYVLNNPLSLTDPSGFGPRGLGLKGDGDGTVCFPCAGVFGLSPGDVRHDRGSFFGEREFGSGPGLGLRTGVDVETIEGISLDRPTIFGYREIIFQIPLTNTTFNLVDAYAGARGYAGGVVQLAESLAPDLINQLRDPQTATVAEVGITAVQELANQTLPLVEFFVSIEGITDTRFTFEGSEQVGPALVQAASLFTLASITRRSAAVAASRGTASGLDDLARFRAELGLKPGEAALARLDVGGKQFFGINAHGQRISLQVNAITRTHAEADAFQQAANAGATGRSVRGRLTVDRDLCRPCGQNGGVRGLARQLGLDELEVITPTGTQVIRP